MQQQEAVGAERGHALQPEFAWDANDDSATGFESESGSEDGADRRCVFVGDGRGGRRSECRLCWRGAEDGACRAEASNSRSFVRAWCKWYVALSQLKYPMPPCVAVPDLPREDLVIDTGNRIL